MWIVLKLVKHQDGEALIPAQTTLVPLMPSDQPVGDVVATAARDDVDETPTIEIGEPGAIPRRMLGIGSLETRLVHTERVHASDPLGIIDQRGAGHAPHASQCPTHAILDRDRRDWCTHPDASADVSPGLFGQRRLPQDRRRTFRRRHRLAHAFAAAPHAFAPHEHDRPARHRQLAHHVLTAVVDVCIVVCDGLKGVPDAINTIWPAAIVQTCVLHLIRNTSPLASRQHWEGIAKDLRPVYTAVNEADAAGRTTCSPIQ
jgi:hypothetical protein